MSDIIKATAKLQDTQEPIRQKPIIQIDNQLKPLPNTIRASLDSGRDNPFRPDGKIYKSADPIVDFYRQAQNQSRPQSPTESQLLIEGKVASGGGGGGGAKTKRKEEAKEGERKSCWRRWFCCCCCCFKCGGKSNKEDENQITIIEHQIEPYNNKEAAASMQSSRLLLSRQNVETSGSKRSNLEFTLDKELSNIEDNKPGAVKQEKDSRQQREGAEKASRCVIS